MQSERSHLQKAIDMLYDFIHRTFWKGKATGAIRPLVASGWERREGNGYKGASETFLGDGNILHLDSGGSHPNVYICQNAFNSI